MLPSRPRAAVHGSSRAAGRQARRGALLLAAVVAAGPPARADAQLVAPKTVPVHQDDQWAIFPSARAGLAGALIAIDDTLLDPFVNPAKAARVREGRVFGAPLFHGISGNRGGGKTLSLGGAGAAGHWSATGVFALQQLDRAGPAFDRPISERTALNRYMALALARRLGGGVSVGGSAYWAGLGAVDGVDLLYGGSDRIDQDGSLVDVRLGATKQWAGNRTLELLVLHDRYAMTHDVRFTDWQRDPSGRGPGTRTQRVEHNVDRTHTWGLHSEYVQPVGREGWRLGALATANRLAHPKIPNYVIMNIPRDPGTTYAFNAGVGLGRQVGGTTFAVDAIYEPMFSETWADAASDTATAGGGVIRAGGKTVENTFRFQNTRLRVGIGHDARSSADSASSVGFQLGLGVYSIDYRLKQRNNVQRTSRVQDERWIEWSPTFALRFRTSGFDLQYVFRMTCGPTACAPDFGGTTATDAVAPGGGGVIAAPSGPLFFEGGRATSHQFLVSVPVR